MTEITREQIEAATGDELNRLVELLCFGDDLSCFEEDGTERWDRIAEVCRRVLSVYNCGKGLSVSVKSPELNASNEAIWTGRCIIDYANTDHHGMFGDLHAWDNRQGKPYQSDLENHVNAYRVKPRDFERDMNLAMELWQDEWSLSRDMMSMTWRIIDFWSNDDLIAKSDDNTNSPAQAICRAACISKLKTDNYLLHSKGD